MVSFSPLDPVRYQWSHFNFYDGLGKFREVSRYVNTGYDALKRRHRCHGTVLKDNFGMDGDGKKGEV
jgi:hypothetical protein